MTSSEYEAGTGYEIPARGRSCGECDPGLLDELRCRARGVQAEADYHAQKLDELTQARTRYDAARAAYGAARDTAAPTVAQLREQLAQVIEQLKCLVDDAREIWLLDNAYANIQVKLTACGDTSGCYFQDDCDFDAPLRNCRPDDIPARIADIERRVQAAKAAFTDLVAEPTALPARVAAVEAEIQDIKTRMGGDPRTTDFKRLYAAALVAGRHLAAVWRGFPHTNAYVDCLCRTLTCQVRGHSAIAKLLGRAAVRACHAEAKAARCEHLRQHTVDEVMAEYIRLRSRPQQPGVQDDPAPGREGDRDADDNDRHRVRQRERDADRYGPVGHDG